MSLKVNRTAVRFAAAIAASALAFFGMSAIASADPDDSSEPGIEVPVTEVPTPNYDDSGESGDVGVTPSEIPGDVEGGDEEDTDTTGDGEFIPGATWEETEPVYPPAEGEDWTDDSTTTPCPPSTTEEIPPPPPCCDEEDQEEEDDQDDEDQDDEEEPQVPPIINDNNNENNNSNENNNVIIVPPVNNGGGGDDIGGVEVNVPVEINIDGSTVTVTKITETNVLNETTVRTPGGNIIVIKPDGNGRHTVVSQEVVKEVSPQPSHTGHDPVLVGSNSPLGWVGDSLAGLVFIGGTVYAVHASRRKSVDNAGRS
jgi:hypothetical protein